MLPRLAALRPALCNEGVRLPGNRRASREARRKNLIKAARRRPLRLPRPWICRFLQSGAPWQEEEEAFCAPLHSRLILAPPNALRMGAARGLGAPMAGPAAPAGALTWSHAPSDKTVEHYESCYRPTPFFFDRARQAEPFPAALLRRLWRRLAALLRMRRRTACLFPDFPPG